MYLQGMIKLDREENIQVLNESELGKQLMYLYDICPMLRGCRIQEHRVPVPMTKQEWRRTK